MNDIWKGIDEFKGFEIVNTGLAVIRPTIITDTTVKITERLKEAISKCFENANLSRERRKLIESFLSLSKGKVIFEISFEQAAKEVYKNKIKKKKPEKKQFENMKDGVSQRLKTLVKWQQKNSLEFLRILREGYGTKDHNGQYDWQPTKLEFVLLSKWVQVQAENPTDTLESNLEKLKASYNVKVINPKNN